MTKIGAKFLELRVRKKLSLDEVSSATKIKKEFLEAIENGDFIDLPSSTYAYGFVRNYAKFLGLNENQATALFRREFDSENSFEVLPQGLFKKENLTSKKIRIGRNFILILGVFIFILSFIFFQYKDAVFNPNLQIVSPKDNQIIVGSDLDVKGSTSPNNTVYVDDQLVFVDEFGNFTKIITVFPGKTDVFIKVSNRFGKETQVDKHISVKPGY
jgi:cytoskeletal protein RodZ